MSNNITIVLICLLSSLFIPRHKATNYRGTNLSFDSTRISLSDSNKSIVDSSSMILKLLNSGKKIVMVPSGTFFVKNITIPKGVTLKGSGVKSILIPLNNSGNFITLSSNSSIQRLKLSGRTKMINSIFSGYVSNVNIDDVIIEDFNGMGLETDHSQNIVVSNSKFIRTKRAANFIFSNKIKVQNNYAESCKEHGFQFWGNWKWIRKDSSDLQFIKNTVKNCGDAGIWGAGAHNVQIVDNVVSGAKDVGIDLEWVDSAIIKNNRVSYSNNGGISLFFSCKDVVISNNFILNNWPIPKKVNQESWWVRSGIWLTYTNKTVYPQDFGHSNIQINRNIITCASGERRAMWIGTGSKQVRLFDNKTIGCKIWQGGQDQPMKIINDNSIIN